MKMLKKLALVSAVSMISAGAFAMEAMDEETMSATTGQDGLTILVLPDGKTGTELAALGVSNAAMAAIDVGGTANNGATQDVGTNDAFKGLSISSIVIHDDDGWTAAMGGSAATSNSGAIVVGTGGADSTVVFADDTQPIRIDIDAVGDHDNNGTDSPMLNVRIGLPTIGVKVGKVYVADSDAVNGTTTANDTDGTTEDNRVEIMDKMEMRIGATTLNIQLGNETQGGMIAVNASILGGLTIDNQSLKDVNSGGAIMASKLTVVDNGGANLTANVVINAVGNAGPAGAGLYVTLAQVGDATNGIDVTLNDQFIGDSTATTTTMNDNMGDIQIKGLNLNGTTLVVKGH